MTTRPAYSIFLCPDSRLLRKRLDVLLADHPPQSGGPWRRFVIWGDEGLPLAFWEHLTLQGLFATPKALILRHAQLLPVEILKPLSDALAPLSRSRGTELAAPLLWPFLCLEAPFEKGKARISAPVQRLTFYTTAEQQGWLLTLPGLARSDLPAFIRAEAEQLGIQLRPHELALLAEALPPDAAHIGSEMAKLALTTTPDGHLPENLAEQVGQAQELGIFELLRIIQQNRNAPAAWRRILEDRLSGENLVFAFTAIMLREARILWQCLVGQPPFLSDQIVRQKKMQAERLGFSGTARLWEFALQADKGIKNGERTPDQAFEILAADLFLLFGNKQ
jgi:DNA polymerase-3 subunit delta